MQDTSAKRMIENLVFVYAADTGRLAAVADSAKKLLMIEGCSLCAITHGLLGERSEWRTWYTWSAAHRQTGILPSRE